MTRLASYFGQQQISICSNNHENVWVDFQLSQKRPAATVVIGIANSDGTPQSRRISKVKIVQSSKHSPVSLVAYATPNLYVNTVQFLW